MYTYTVIVLPEKLYLDSTNQRHFYGNQKFIGILGSEFIYAKLFTDKISRYY